MRVYVRTRERRYETTTFAVRRTRGPRFGMRVTNTEHAPFFVPRTLVPTNSHDVDPRTMVSRMVPRDVFGIANETCAAMVRAVMVRPRFTVRYRGVDARLC